MADTRPCACSQNAQTTRDDRRGSLRPTRRARWLDYLAHPPPDPQEGQPGQADEVRRVSARYQGGDGTRAQLEDP